MGHSEEEGEKQMLAESDYTVEFRAEKDEAWYTVCVLLEGEDTLRVKYFNFPDEEDNAFRASEFWDHNKLRELEERFRPLSKQVQDSECPSLVQGVRVCACHSFSDDDLRYYDAVIDGVQRSKHSWKEGEESCSCTFILFWLEGPNAGSLTATKIEDICLVQPEWELDPAVVSFLEMAREKMDPFFSSRSVSGAKGVSHLEMVPHQNKRSNTTARVIDYFKQIEKEKRCARLSVVKVGSPEVRKDENHDILSSLGTKSIKVKVWDLKSNFIKVSCEDMEDRVLEGTKNVCMILIANIDRELCPSAIAEFLHRHTSVSATVFIFPNLSLEVYTRGAIMLDSEKDFQALCDFLNNPYYIITSSTCRPWVIIEKLVGLKKIKASIGTLGHISKNILKKRKSQTSNNLKVVHLGTQEFKIASEMRDLFLEFSNHLERLHKRLALEERKVFTADEQLA